MNNSIIDLIENKQTLYSPIYNLALIKPKNQKTYVTAKYN